MKKITILFLSIVLVSATFVNAANEEGKSSESALTTTKLSGKVLDKITGEALAGVKITLNDSESTVYTDFDGNFELVNIIPGTVELKASYISYKEKIESVQVDLRSSNSVEVQIENISE